MEEGAKSKRKALNLPVDLLWGYEMSFVCMVAGLSLRDKVKSLDIQREVGVQRSQLRWFRHLIRIPSEHLPLEVLLDMLNW